MSNNLTEYEECKVFANYLREQWIRFSHIPNSTWTPSWGQRTKNKLLWVSSWFPDYVIVVPTKEKWPQIVYIEMKVVKWWTISENQYSWIRSIESCWQIVTVCRWSQEAIEYVKSLMI